MATIADRLSANVDEIADELVAAQIELSPVLGADAAIAAEVHASDRANVLRFLAIAHHADEAPPRDVPPEALDVARTLVRRGIEIDVILRAYGRGQQLFLERWMACADETVEAGPEQMRVTRLSIALLFDYLNDTVRQVLAEATREREEVLGGALARRTETVRLILDGAPVDAATASARIGYELGHHHTAVVLWAESAAVPHGALEAAAIVLARAAGARRPLTLPAGTTTLWAWIGSDGEPCGAELRAALEASDPGVRAAVGPTRRGITGFRHSHEAALAVHALLAARTPAERLTTYDELEVTVLAAHDQQRAGEFVAATLGPLAEDTPAAARLRETLQMFLDEAEHAPRAAARLDIHRNTVLKRVARATELLGHPLRERRLAVELALELSRRLGP
jgi:DNA-binding PucR family transcriptional regulator